MNQSERRRFLIDYLIKENPGYQDMKIPVNKEEQKRMLRGLMNVRMPRPISDIFLKIQDEYLAIENREKGITELSQLTLVADGIYLWRGDITTLKVDAIVNAANSGMTGCYHPCHGCIDNAIHTYSGVQLRLECADLVEKQGYEEETGKAKITKAYNLPCNYVIHTVGPIVGVRLTEKDCKMLASCYHSCLEAADKNHLKTIAFCCISTGEFHFPNGKAAQIAVDTVRKYKETTQSKMEVIFNVFKEQDDEIYRKLFRKD